MAEKLLSKTKLCNVITNNIHTNVYNERDDFRILFIYIGDKKATDIYVHVRNVYFGIVHPGWCLQVIQNARSSCNCGVCTYVHKIK